MLQKIKDLLDGKTTGKEVTCFIGPTSKDISYKGSSDAASVASYLAWANPEVSADIIRQMVDEEMASRRGDIVGERTELPNELAVAEADGVVTESELNAMTKAALKEYAAKHDIEIGMLATKATILTAVKDAVGITEKPAEK